MTESESPTSPSAAPGWWLALDGTWRPPSQQPSLSGPNSRAAAEQSVAPLPEGVDVGSPRCRSCGSATKPEARFCHHCGANTAGDTNEAIGVPPPIRDPSSQRLETIAEVMVEYLAGEVPATGRVVVCLDLSLRRPQRLEVRATDGVDAFSEEDRVRLLDAISAASGAEGWIAAEVDDAGVWGTMVWHIVGEGVFPLTESHARAMLNSFDGLLLPHDTDADQAVDGSSIQDY
jgi:hypothetical protein